MARVEWALSDTLSLDCKIKADAANLDRLVYDLYGLTASEIAIVEGGDRTNKTDGSDEERR